MQHIMRADTRHNLGLMHELLEGLASRVHRVTGVTDVNAAHADEHTVMYFEDAGCLVTASQLL